MSPHLLSALTRMGSRVAPAHIQNPDRVPSAARRDALDRADRLAAASAARLEKLPPLDTPARPTTARRDYSNTPCQPMRAAAKLFVSDAEGSTPLTMTERMAIMQYAYDLELATKGKGRKNGALGQTGLRVLNVLLFRFQNVTNGLCCPSFSTMKRVTGFCIDTINNAVYRLEQSGIMIATRRRVRSQVTRQSRITGLPETFMTTRQGTNLYRFLLPSAPLLSTALHYATHCFSPIRSARRHWARVAAAAKARVAKLVSDSAPRGENQTTPPPIPNRPMTGAIVRHKTAADHLCNVLKGWA